MRGTHLAFDPTAMVSHMALPPFCGRHRVYRMISSATSASTWKVHVKDHDDDDDDDGDGENLGDVDDDVAEKL